MVASSRRSVSQGAARKTARKKIKKRAAPRSVLLFFLRGERGSKFAQHDGFCESEAAKLVCMWQNVVNL